MDNSTSFLIDWSIRFLENKDAIRKEIVKIEKNKADFDFIIDYKDKINYFIVISTLENDIFSILKNSDGIFGTPKIERRFSSEIKSDSYFGIFTLNNLMNIRFVASNWKRLTDFRFLSIYFINPFSSSDKVWTICPYVHDKICDKASLELGLKSMAEMVAPLGIEELNNKIKLLREESDL